MVGGFLLDERKKSRRGNIHIKEQTVSTQKKQLKGSLII